MIEKWVWFEGRIESLHEWRESELVGDTAIVAFKSLFVDDDDDVAAAA